ncbi:MAG: hypothetical protein QOE14_1212 [Humisphaera sp.]|nr:hypothetical protein [Humisphaera sp.]
MMHLTHSRAAVALVAAALLATFAAPAAAHEVELLVGRSAGNQIKIDADLVHPFHLPPSIFPGIPGYAFGEPAFHSTVLDDVANDLFQFSPTADFQFILLSKDPGIEVYTAAGPLPLNTPLLLGPSPFDSHPVWHIPAGPTGVTYNLTLKIQDTTGAYTDSAPFAMQFTSVPEPHTLALIALAPLVLRRRRDRR